MSPVQHALASAVVSGGFFYATRSWPGTFLCFVSGVLWDIDHVFDFWIAKRKIFFPYKELFEFCTYEKNGKLYLIFHAYELMAVLWLMVFIFPSHWVWKALAVGGTMHMILDRMVNPLKPFVFFFFYRWRHQFDRKHVFPDWYYEKLT